ncbi:MAG: FxLYD domain-containing protein [Limisphaerales bacterium]
MEMPEEARKCPHCHHFQNRWTMMMFHPGFAVLFFSLPLIGMSVVFSIFFYPGENYATYKDQIVVNDCRIALGDTKSAATVAVIGTIKNNSKVSWKDIKFHVDFFDAAGKRADVGQREEYRYGLAAGETSSFKVSFTREFLETNYVKPVVRIVGATDMRSIW